MSPGRVLALHARQAAERGRRIERAFHGDRGLPDRRERAFAQELAYGVTRLRGRLDHLIAPHVHRGLEALDPSVHEILRLGAYQILYMNVPPYAAVSQAVDQVRNERGLGPTGLVNAVLRQVARAGDGLDRFPSFDEDPADFLTTWGSHPRWLLERWLARWDAAEVRQLVEANNRTPELYVVPLDVEPREAAATLGDAGIDAEPVGDGTKCVRLAAGVLPAAALVALSEAVVQDPAANLVARYADVPLGTKVADLCAAPGGKALAVSDRALHTLAADRSESRLRMVRENARRTGRPLALVVADARRPPLTETGVVLLDAPCSGTGTLARRADARWRLRPESIPELAALQREMLEEAASVVAEGGVLVYSTCTLEPEENEQLVDAFLRDHSDFRIDATDAVPPRFLDPDGRLVVTPGAPGCDGAFAARMRRAA